MAKSYDNIRVFGDVDTDVYIGAKGSTLPEVLGEPPAPFEALGWLGEDGTPLAVTTEIQKFKAYQGGTLLRTKVTSTEKSVKVQGLESNPLVTGLYFDHGSPVVTTGVAKVALPESIGTVERSAVFRWLDGEYERLLCCPLVQIGERGEIPNKNDAMTVYEMTFSIIGDAYLLTNEPSYLAVTP